MLLLVLCISTGLAAVSGNARRSGGGIVCYTCHQLDQRDDCRNVKTCMVGEFCSYSITTNQETRTSSYTTSCETKAACSAMQHNSAVQCSACCDTDLCNKDCMSSSMGTSGGSGTGTGTGTGTGQGWTPSPTSSPIHVDEQTGTGTGHHQTSSLGGTGTRTSVSCNLQDGSFENGGFGWKPYLNGYTVQQSTFAQDGSHFVNVLDGAARQIINFDGVNVRNFVISGYSRPHGAYVGNPHDYSIFCDLNHFDGSETWGIEANFDPFGSSSTWQYVELHVHATVDIRSAWCYALFRRGHGSADFDNFKIRDCN